MKKLTLNDWSKFDDELTAFMLGLDDAVEKCIIRFLYDRKGWVSFQDIKYFAVDKSMICFNPSTLSRRLTSLVNFKIIERRVEHDNKTFYKLDDSFMQELADKKEVEY